MQTYDESRIKSELHTSTGDPNGYTICGLSWNYSVGKGGTVHLRRPIDRRGKKYNDRPQKTRDKNAAATLRSKVFTTMSFVRSSGDLCIRSRNNVSIFSRMRTDATGAGGRAGIHAARRDALRRTPTSVMWLSMGATCSAGRLARRNSENERSAIVRKSCAIYASPLTGTSPQHQS